MPTTKVSNFEINYIKKGNGEPLIFLHGLFSDVRAYTHFINQLSTQFTVYAIDLPMHGKSSHHMDDVSLNSMTKLIHSFIIKHKIKNYTMVGFSAGTLLSINYASKYQLKNLILINPVGLKYYDSRLTEIFNLIIKKTAIDFFKSFSITINLIPIWLDNILRNTFNLKYWYFLYSAIGNDYSSNLKKINVTTTIFWANHDEVLPYKFAHQYKSNIKNSKLITLNATHDLPLLMGATTKSILIKKIIKSIRP